MNEEPVRTFGSVWNAIEDRPSEAANMRLRSELALALRQCVESWNLTQAEAASRLGTTQPRLNDLLRGRLDRFSLDALVSLAERAGLHVEVQITEAA